MGVLKMLIDHFEGQWAVVEQNGTRFKLPRRILPEQIKKGDILTVTIGVNEEDTDVVKLRQHVRAS